MIREYAVDPHVVSSSFETIQRFLSDFGEDGGRAIGAVPHKWFQEVQGGIRALELGTLKQSKCFSELKRIAGCWLVPRDGKSLGEDSWVVKAQKLHQQEPFDAILTTETNEENSIYNYLEIIINFPPNWYVEPTLNVSRTSEDLAAAIEKSLSITSKPVHFVDKYFDAFLSDYRNPLLKFIDVLEKGRFGVKKAYMHTSLQINSTGSNKDRSALEQGMQECLRPRLPNGFEVELWVWDSNKIHDRFVLTSQFGFSFGHGLSEVQYQSAIDVNVHRLGVSSHKNEYRKFCTEAERDGDAICVIGE